LAYFAVDSAAYGAVVPVQMRRVFLPLEVAEELLAALQGTRAEGAKAELALACAPRFRLSRPALTVAERVGN